MTIGTSVKRVDAYEKVTGRCKYTDDLCDKSAYVARIVRSTIAHGVVKSIDTSEAEKIPGVVKIVTCFDVPKQYFGTAGHPWSNDPAHRDIADRLLLNTHVRYYGDDVAAVVADNEVTAAQAARAIKVEYDEYPFVLDAQEAMKDGAPLLHEKYPNNILAATHINNGNYDEAIKDPSLTKVEGWYDTPTVQHCHIENFVCYAYMEQNRIVVVSSTQIPHITRRVTAQALGLDWGSVRIIKPYIGGGFGDKQDVLYEPLCAYLSTQVGGRLVKLDIPREDTFTSCRCRHAIRYHLISYVDKDGKLVARKAEGFSSQGAYASHGHSITAKGAGAIPQFYPCPNIQVDAYTVFTNRTVGGAMRGYGIPQAMFVVESHTDDIAKAIGMDPIAFRRKNLMPVGFVDGFSKNEQYFDTYNQCLDRGIEVFDYENKLRKYQNQTGDIRRGVGVSAFWYNTAVWPISVESSSCRMVMNQDGSIQMQLGETEIGQGADTTFSQMAADTIGLPFDKVHIISCQDTDITPYGSGAYASRQTYSAGFAIKQTALLLKERILRCAHEFVRMPVFNLDIVDGMVIRTTDNRPLISVADVACQTLYSMEHTEHISAESTYGVKSNAYSFGCCFAEVEVDIPACTVKLIDILNVHDAGKIINPALAEAQVHGGISMGIGYGLSEIMLYDEKTGRVLNNNFLDYKLLTTMDHPHMGCEFIENSEPTSAYGTKALGEPPTCPVAPAIRNAVLQATGVAFNELPLRPQNLFDGFTKSGLIKEG